MLKLLSNLFGKKTKSPAHERYSNPYKDILSDDSSRLSSASSSPSGSTVQRVQLRRPFVDEILEVEQKQLQETFRIIDKNGDGKISQQELGEMWASLGEKVTDEELRFMVEEADGNRDGAIDLEEFVTLSKNIGLGTAEDAEEQVEGIRLAFDLGDTDRDGYISAVELQKLVKRLGKKKVTIAESTAMLRCVDSDGDGVLDYQDFEELMKSSVLNNNK